MTPLPITQLGQPVLRARSRRVEPKDGPALRRLIPKMMATMRHAKGVGIAAPQVGIDWQLFIVAPEPSARYPRSPKIPPIVMLNPKLLGHSREMEVGYEGCISIPGIRAVVPRWKHLEAEFTTLEGARRTVRLTGFVARIFQHEFDHIQGHVYLDRVRDSRTFMTEQEYRRLLRRR